MGKPPPVRQASEADDFRFDDKQPGVQSLKFSGRDGRASAGDNEVSDGAGEVGGKDGKGLDGGGELEEPEGPETAVGSIGCGKHVLVDLRKAILGDEKH